MRNARDQTALHVALIAGKLVVAEQLVGYGTDINAVDKDGDTPLNYAFTLRKMVAPSNDNPQLLKVYIVHIASLIYYICSNPISQDKRQTSVSRQASIRCWNSQQNHLGMFSDPRRCQYGD